MSEASKAEKIAAGRKKLKQYQQKTLKSGDKKSHVNKTDSNFTVSPDLIKLNDDKSSNISQEDDFNLQANPLNQSNDVANQDVNFFDFFNSNPSNENNRLQDYFNSSNADLFTALIKNENEEEKVQIEDDYVHVENVNDVTNETPKELNPEESNLLVPTTSQSTPLVSSTETIRMLSSHLQNFIREDNTYDSHSDSLELEKRNQELAAIVANGNVERQQLNERLSEYLKRIEVLETQVKQAHDEKEIQVEKELAPLREQLDYQAKTIGVLVGTKSELQSTIEHIQSSLTEKISECEELQSRLKASKHYVGDLEREINSLKRHMVGVEKNDYKQNVIKLEQQIETLKKQNDDDKMEIAELVQKNNIKESECLDLQKQLADKNSQLTITQLKLQQVYDPDTKQMQNEDKFNLEQKISELTQTIDRLEREKTENSEKYQQYVYQLNTQTKALTSENESLRISNETSQKREQDLISRINVLESELQELQHLKKNPPVVTVPVVKDSDEQNKIHQMELQVAEKSKELNRMLEEKRYLIQELDVRNSRVLELEEKIAEMDNDRPDMKRLEAAMESDKVAAAQAIKQNAKLQQLIVEFEEKFLSLTQEKLTLTEKFVKEQHLGHEILKQLKQRENEIEHLKTILKEGNLESLIEKKVFSDNQTGELTTSKDHAESDHVHDDGHSHDHGHDHHHHEHSHDDHHDHKDHHHDHHHDNNDHYHDHHEKHHHNDGDHQENHSTTNSNENAELKKAMAKLEERFTRQMNEIAQLTEEKQHLEHLVMQLQGETETIGEYIALYQFQRGILRQRSLEKDHELQLLNNDREEMKQKLNQLKYLIRQLVNEYSTSSTIPAAVIKQSEELLSQSTDNSSSYVIENTELSQSSAILTFEKIDQLLGEINSSNLVEPKQEKTAHCPFCQGQLINI